MYNRMANVGSLPAKGGRKFGVFEKNILCTFFKTLE